MEFTPVPVPDLSVSRRACPAPQWIREGHAFLILYSVDEASTFDNAYAMRKKIERAKDVESFPMVLVGNKCDKPNRKITTEQGSQKALEMGCPYIETSAKSGVRASDACHSQFLINIVLSSRRICCGPVQVNIKEAFDLLVREVRKERQPPQVDAKPKCCSVS